MEERKSKTKGFERFDRLDECPDDPKTKDPTYYDEGDVYDVITIDTKIPSHNIGYRLLMKMGWNETGGLGRRQDGRTEPIRVELKEERLGVGKREEDDRQADTVTSKRKALLIEKEETQEQKQQREQKAAKEETSAQEVARINRPFYCELCNKQYTNVAQYDVHLSSYDHGHKKRLAEMKEMNKKMRKDFAKKPSGKKKKKQTKTTAQPYVYRGINCDNLTVQYTRPVNPQPPPLSQQPAPPQPTLFQPPPPLSSFVPPPPPSFVPPPPPPAELPPLPPPPPASSNTAASPQGSAISFGFSSSKLKRTPPPLQKRNFG